MKRCIKKGQASLWGRPYKGSDTAKELPLEKQVRYVRNWGRGVWADRPKVWL